MSLEFPPDCAWLFAALTGEKPPNGDEDRMFELAEVHKDLHGKLSNDFKQQISEALGFTRQSFDGDAAAMYQAAMKSFIGEEGLSYFDAVADQAKLLGDFTRAGATQLQYTKYMIIAQLVELLLEAVVAAALAFFFGASIQAYLAKVAIVRFLIRSWLGRLLMTVLMHEVINVGMGVAMDLLVQWTQFNQGTRDSYDGTLTKGAALSGMVQGLLAGPFQFLGSKFGKGLAKIFGKDGGRALGKEIDKALPPPPVHGPKGPTGAGPEAPKTFGDDIAKNFADHLPKTAGPGAKAAGDAFVHAVGDTFKKHLGGNEARDAGRAWAKALLTHTGKPDLPQSLGRALAPLGKEVTDGPLGKVLSQGAADVLARNVLRSVAGAGALGLGKGVFEGTHAAVSEGTYNLVFSDEHTFKTSGLTFGSGMAEGRIGHLLETRGEHFGADLRNSVLEAGLKLPGHGAQAPGGPSGEGGAVGGGAGTGGGAGISTESIGGDGGSQAALAVTQDLDPLVLDHTLDDEDTAPGNDGTPLASPVPQVAQVPNGPPTATPPPTHTAATPPVVDNAQKNQVSANTPNTSSTTTSSPTGQAPKLPRTTSKTVVGEQENQENTDRKQESEDKQLEAENKQPVPPTESSNDVPLSPRQKRIAQSDDSNTFDKDGNSSWGHSHAPPPQDPPRHTTIVIESESDVNQSDATELVSPLSDTEDPVSTEVETFGTQDSEGISGVHFEPITEEVAKKLQKETLDRLEDITGLPLDQLGEARTQLSTLLSPQALDDHRVMLFSKDGHTITVTAGGRAHTLDVQLQLSRPRPSALHGTGKRQPPHNNEQRQTAVLDTTHTASTTAVRTVSVNAISHVFSWIKTRITGVPFTFNINATHQQTNLSSTVSGAVNSTSLLRSTETASPFDYTVFGRVRTSTSEPFQPIGQDGSELGTVTAWFPEHLALPDYGTEGGKVFATPEDLAGHLATSPLWVMDSMSDPGSLLREVRKRFGKELDLLGPDSLRAVEKYFGAEYLLGALPIQHESDRPGGTVGTFSPVLLKKNGKALGMFKVTAEIKGRTDAPDIRVGSKYSLERFLERQLKADSLAKVSSAVGPDLAAGLALNQMPAEADKAFRDFNPGGSFQLKGSYNKQWDRAFGAGAMHSVTHNIRTNDGHILTPANVVYKVEFIPTDGRRSTPLDMPPTRVRIRTLTPGAGTVPAAGAEKEPPPEVAQLDSIGLTTTPLAVHGDGVGTVFEQARGWLRDHGYLPRPDGAGDERLILARLENLRRLSLLESQYGMLGMLDELVDGGSPQYFSKPVLGGGEERVRLDFTLDRDPRADKSPTHLTTLSGVHLPSISTVSLPGTGQQSSGTTWTGGVSGQGGGHLPGRIGLAGTFDHKSTYQTTDTSTAGGALSQSQFILTSNQTTEVFRVPAVFAVNIVTESGPLPGGPFTSEHQEVNVDLAVPHDRTTQVPQTYEEAVVEPAGTRLPADDTTFLLPDSSLVDVLRGSKQLYQAVESILADIAAGQNDQQPPPVQQSAQTPGGDNTSMPGAWPEEFELDDLAERGEIGDTPPPLPSSSWFDVTKSVFGYLGNGLHQFVSGGDSTNGTILLHEALHAQLSPAALLARAHQLVKGVFVIDDLFVPGKTAGTDLVVEVRAVLTNPKDLGLVTQYGETDIGVTDSASHQRTKATSHEFSLGLAGKYGQSREEVEQQEPAQTPTGSGAFKATYGFGTGSSATTSASTNITRVPSESGPQHRINADIRYEITVRHGHRRVSPLNETAPPVTRTVHVPGGITFLATDAQLRRSGTMLESFAHDEEGGTATGGPQLPYHFVKHGALGLAAVLEATPLEKKLDPPGTTETTQTTQTTETTQTTPATNDDPRRPHLLRQRLTELVRSQAPGSLTPGHRNYVPGLAQRIADYTSPIALAALPGRGADGELTFTFPYTDGLVTRTVTVRVHGKPAWNEEELRRVRGSRANTGAGVENYSSHAPANVATSHSRTTRWGLGLPFSIAHRVPNGRVTLNPSLSGSSVRTDTVNTNLSAEDRVWQRVEGGNEFTLGYLFGATLDIDGEQKGSIEVDGRVVLRFAGDHDEQPGPQRTPEPVVRGTTSTDPRLSGPLQTATPLRPTGDEVVYALDTQDELLRAVQELEPSLAGGDLTSGTSAESAAVRLTELVHGGKITMDPVRMAAGAGGAVTGTGKHPQVTLSTQLYRPRLLDSTKNVTLDRLRITGFTTSTSSSNARNAALGLGITGTTNAGGGFDFGGSTPLGQSRSSGQGGGASAVSRHWEKTGTPGPIDAEQGLVTHLVEVDTVTTVTGKDGKVRYVTGTAVMRVSERDLLGLGVLDEADRGEGVFDLSAPDFQERTPAQIASMILAAESSLPPGAVPQLWLDLGTNPTPEARLEALYRAQVIAQESGRTVELALRDQDGTRIWTFRPEESPFPNVEESRARLDEARIREAKAVKKLAEFENEYGRRGTDLDLDVGELEEAVSQAEAELSEAEDRVTEAREGYMAKFAEADSFGVTKEYASEALISTEHQLQSLLAGATPDQVVTLAQRESRLRSEIERLQSAVKAHDKMRDAKARWDKAVDKQHVALYIKAVASLTLDLSRARRDLQEAKTQHSKAETELLAMGPRLAEAHRPGGTQMPGLTVPPVTDPTAQSLASLTPQWPSPKSPADGPTPPGSGTGTGKSTGTGHTREEGKRTPHPVLPHEVARFEETDTAAVHTERFDPKQVQTRREAGRLNGSMTLIRNHVRRMRMPDGRMVRQFFVPLPIRLTDGLTPQDLADFEARVQSALDTIVNAGYVLPDSGDQLHVTAEFSEDDTHSEAVTLSRADGTPNRAHQRAWDVGHSDAELVHELLHYLGLADEYSDAREAPENRHLFRRHDSASAVRDRGLMVNTGQESTQNLPQEYLAVIERVSENAVIRTYDVKVPPPPPGLSDLALEILTGGAA